MSSLETRTIHGHFAFRGKCSRGKLLKTMARPERFELPTFWFVDRSSKTSKCRYWCRLQANAPLNLLLKLDGSWTELMHIRGSCELGMSPKLRGAAIDHDDRDSAISEGLNIA